MNSALCSSADSARGEDSLWPFLNETVRISWDIRCTSHRCSIACPAYRGMRHLLLLLRYATPVCLQASVNFKGVADMCYLDFRVNWLIYCSKFQISTLIFIMENPIWNSTACINVRSVARRSTLERGSSFLPNKVSITERLFAEKPTPYLPEKVVKRKEGRSGG